MKSNQVVIVFAFWVITSALAGCVGDPPFAMGPPPSTDTDSDSDTDSDTDTDTDADSDTDTDTDTDSDTGPLECEESFNPVNEWGGAWREEDPDTDTAPDPSDDPWVVYWNAEEGITDAPPMYTAKWYMDFSAWESYGAPMVPETASFTGPNSSWATCWYCLFLDENITWDTSDGWSLVDKDARYMAYEGDIDITSIDVEDMFTAELTDVYLREVDEDNNIINNGKVVCWDSISFSVDLSNTEEGR